MACQQLLPRRNCGELFLSLRSPGCDRHPGRHGGLVSHKRAGPLFLLRARRGAGTHPSAGAGWWHWHCSGWVSSGTEDGVHGRPLSQPRAPLPYCALGSTAAFQLPLCQGTESSAVPDPAQGHHVHRSLPKQSQLPGPVRHAGEAVPSPNQAEGTRFVTACFPGGHRFHGSKSKAAPSRCVLKLCHGENTN